MNPFIEAICEDTLFICEDGKIITCPKKDNLSVKVNINKKKQVLINYIIKGKEEGTTFIYSKDDMDYLIKIKLEIEFFFHEGQIHSWIDNW